MVERDLGLLQFTGVLFLLSRKGMLFLLNRKGKREQKLYLPKGLVRQVSSLRPESRPRSAGLAPSGWKQAESGPGQPPAGELLVGVTLVGTEVFQRHCP